MLQAASWGLSTSSVFAENWCLYKMKQQGWVKSKMFKWKCGQSLARLERETIMTLDFQPLTWREIVFLLSCPQVLYSNQDLNVSSLYLKKSIGTQVRLLWILQEWAEMQSVYCIPEVFIPICIGKWMLEWKPCPWSRRQKEGNIWASNQLRKFHELKTWLISLARIQHRNVLIRKSMKCSIVANAKWFQLKFKVIFPKEFMKDFLTLYL